jgi:phospho-N-acetylmuramoyl-pentapeptide-transferase
MLPELLRDLFDVSLFDYISVRMALAAMTAFLLALFSGAPVIRWLRANRVQETAGQIDSIELAEHAEKSGKTKTTTMGGSFLICSLLLSVLLWARLDNLHVVFAIVLTAGLAAVGFVDDFKKLTIPHCNGLSRRSKYVGLSVVVFGVLGVLVWWAEVHGRSGLLVLHPPIFKNIEFNFLSYGAVGVVAFLIFEWFVIVGTSNAVNITDGLDGLAAGCTIISVLALSIFCYVTGRVDWSAYLNIPHVREASEMAVVGGAMIGACMGFLWYNAYPAKVFMGDSGSLPLGGLMAWMAVVSKQELVLPIVGIVFVIEILSSLIQTQIYVLTGRGKRVFTMAPVHHGLERFGGVFKKSEQGWHEVTVVVRFWIIAVVGAMASLALLKVR